MKRYRYQENSNCLGCGCWLCVMGKGATFTVKIQCKCGTINVFKDSCKPVERLRAGERT